MPALAEAGRALGRAVERYLPTRLPAPSLREVVSHPIQSVILTTEAAVLALLMACGTDQGAKPVTLTPEPNKPTDVGGAAVPGTPVPPTELPTPTATAAPGVGVAVPTFEPGSKNKDLNKIIDDFNAGKQVSQEDLNRVNAAKAAEAEAKAKAAAGEVEKAGCFIDDVEACKSARMVKIGGREYVEVQVKPGIQLVTRLDGGKTVFQAQPPFQGVRISIGNPNTTEVEDFRGDINAEVKQIEVPVQNGNSIGTTKDGKIYVRLTKVEPGKGITLDRGRTGDWFPGILEQPITELTAATQSKPDIDYKFEG